MATTRYAFLLLSLVSLINYQKAGTIHLDFKIYTFLLKNYNLLNNFSTNMQQLHYNANSDTIVRDMDSKSSSVLKMTLS